MSNIQRITGVLILGLYILPNAVAARYDDLRTFGEADLEPVLEIKEDVVSFNGLDSLSADIREEFKNSFRVVPLKNRIYWPKGFYLLDDSGSIEEYIYADEIEGVVLPSSSGDKYLTCTDRVSNFNFTPTLPVVKELYTIDGKTLWRDEITGFVYASDDLSTVGVFISRGGGELLPNFTTITADGLKHSEYKTYCTFPVTVSRDGEIVVFAEPHAPTTSETPKGTRVFDISGNLLFTLDPGYLCDVGPGTHKPLVLYASSRYIIQACHKITRRVGTPPQTDEEGRVYEGIRTIRGEHYVQVYDRNGVLLWQKGYSGVVDPIAFAVSDNDEFIAIYNPQPTPRYEVLRLATGEQEYEGTMDSRSGEILTNIGVSNDGSGAFFVLREVSEKPGPTTTEIRLLLFKKGGKIAELKDKSDYSAEDSDYDLRFSEGGRFVAITVKRNLTILQLLQGKYRDGR